MMRGSPNDPRLEELWRELEERIERFDARVTRPADELLDHLRELHIDVMDDWAEGRLLRPEIPMSMDILVVGFPDQVGRVIAQYLRGLNLKAWHIDDNRSAYALMQVAHTRAVLWDVRKPSPGAFIRMTLDRHPHIKGIAIGDPSDRQTFNRVRRRGAHAFIPVAESRNWSERARPFEQCVLASLRRQAKVCPNYAKGRPCLGECAIFEGPATPPPGSRFVPNPNISGR